MGHVQAGGGGEGGDHLLHAGALAGSEVERLESAFVSFQPTQGRHVGLGQIADVEVVPDAGAVRGGVVIPEDRQRPPQSGHGLGQEGHEVGRRAEWQLSDLGAGVRADGVEVPQQRDPEISTGRLVGLVEQGFTGLLGESVGRGGGQDGGRLGDREVFGLPVDGAGRAEDQMPDPVATEQSGETGRAANVVVDVLLGLFDAFPDGLVRRKMDGAMNRPFQDGGHCVGVSAIDTVPFDLPVEDAPDAVDDLFPAVSEVVHEDGVIAGLNEGDSGVGADETGASGHHDALACLRALGHAAISVTFPPQFP